MSQTQKPISIEDAISSTPMEAADDLHAWQVKKLAERKKSADDGRFASAETVKAVIRKFVPNG
jgi:predicted transcriptional regulator